MGLLDHSIKYKHCNEALVASLRTTVKDRKEIYRVVMEISQVIPQEMINGPPFCIFQFVTSVEDGHDVEIGFPVDQSVHTNKIRTRILPPVDVLSLIHTGSPETLPESYRELFNTAAQYGIISDEFCREIYPDWSSGEVKSTELQFIIHNWQNLLAASLEQILGKDACKKLMQPAMTLAITSNLDKRFLVTKDIIENIDRLDDEQKYDIISRCAHRFPQSQIDKLRQVYQRIFEKTGNTSDAVNAVIEFMAVDPGWEEKPIRKGNIIYSSKAPRDPRAFEKAKTDEEKRKAYCFCPIIRERLDKGMPVTFCYCGAGWYRQQWEGTIGRPVRVHIVECLLKGDERCQFAIYLPDDISSRSG